MTFYISFVVVHIIQSFDLMCFVHVFLLFTSIVHCNCESNLCNLNMIYFTETVSAYL